MGNQLKAILLAPDLVMCVRTGALYRMDDHGIFRFACNSPWARATLRDLGLDPDLYTLASQLPQKCLL
jgi:hypothetical protein